MHQNERFRPFHETIVSMIENCNSSPSSGQIFLLLQLIQYTKIPQGHDEIVAAIDKFFDFPGASKYSREIRVTKESISLQKLIAQREKTDHADRAYKDSLTHGGR